MPNTLSAFAIADAIISPLGSDADATYAAIKEGRSSLKAYTQKHSQTYVASLFDADQCKKTTAHLSDDYSLFEKLCIAVAEQALRKTDLKADSSSTCFVLSSTKGNVGLLEKKELDQRLPLYTSAKKIGAYFGNPNPVPCVSVACISGIAAQIFAKRLLEAEKYEHVVLIGCDVFSNFIVDGFNAFQALSSTECRPFDQERNGLNLGEAAACLILSNKPAHARSALMGGSVTNDANHLSGPSRTGEELGEAISRSLEEAALLATQVDCIVAHGTATAYNDEMEAKAFNHAGIAHAATYSLKSYFGHTLGAAGLIETIIGLRAMKENLILQNRNFSHSNCSMPVNIAEETHTTPIHNFVKTGAGFGSCNAAVVWKKMEQ